MEKKLLSVDDGVNLSFEKICEYHTENVNPGLVKAFDFIKFNKHYVKAEGNYIWDDEGNKYLDLVAGYGSVNVGHNHPEVLQAIGKVSHLPNLFQISLRKTNAALAYNLARITPGNLNKTFFCNSGAEAVEGALKIARIATGKKNIVSAIKSFHGKTMGALTATGQEKYQNYFTPLVPGFSHFKYGDLKGLEALLKKKDVAAVILEPIQGEGGVILPPEGFLPAVRELCTKYKALLILDEVQTGFGRTGKMFACEHEEVEPDILCLAKALGGGVMPIGAFMTTDSIWQKAYGPMEKSSIHTTTFGGNTMACAAGLAAIEIIYKEKLIENAEKVGTYLISKLQKMAENFKIIKEVRGKGLFIAIEFKQINKVVNVLTGNALEELASAAVARDMLNEQKIITTYTINNPGVIRIEPPLSLTMEEADRIVEAFEKTLSKNKSHFSMLKNIM